MVFLHALVLEQFKEAAFGFLIEALRHVLRCPQFGQTASRRPAEEVSHLNSAGLVLVDHFKCCEALIHAEMDMNHVYFRSQRGAPAQLVRGI